VPGGDEQGKYELGAPKSRRSVRSVSLPQSVLSQLDRGRDWLFVNSQGGPIRLYSWRTNVWVPSLAKAKRKDVNNPERAVLEKTPRIHDLRHTCAPWLLVGQSV
jgi:integrase